MFNEDNTVEQLVRDLLCGTTPTVQRTTTERTESYVIAGLGKRGAGWHFIPAVALPRQAQDLFVEAHVREALIRLNPVIEREQQRANHSDWCDEVIHKLRAIVLSVRSEGLIVTAKLLTGFDAPILQAMYLDKPMRDHTLLQAIILDAEVLDAVLHTPDPAHKAQEIQIKVAARLRQRMGNPRFRALSERLEALKERHEQGQMHSIDFLKALLDLARDLLQAERDIPPEEDVDQGKAALTELFQEARTPDTPIVVERVVNDIDEIVRFVRFDGWQSTSAGEREVKRALRRALLKYQLHQETELLEKAYGYVKEYY